MNIKLVGALPRQLRELGLRSGDRFQNVEVVEGNRYGAVRVRFMHEEEEQVATIYKENYIKL